MCLFTGLFISEGRRARHFDWFNIIKNILFKYKNRQFYLFYCFFYNYVFYYLRYIHKFGMRFFLFNMFMNSWKTKTLAIQTNIKSQQKQLLAFALTQRQWASAERRAREGDATETTKSDGRRKRRERQLRRKRNKMH